MPNHISNEEGESVWQNLPDSLLLHIFQYLPPQDLLRSVQVCKWWHRVGTDELLWRDLFYVYWKVDRTVPMAPGKTSWLGEFKRLYYHTPQVESEMIGECLQVEGEDAEDSEIIGDQHRDQVLHVSFSHSGDMFATSSKDGYVKVWTATSYPTRLKYYANMKEYTWKYTQYTQFNKSDTLLLVSGVHFGWQSTSGEIAVFNIVDGFELQCRVLNKPYDIFGTWYNDNYLLSGNLYWMGQLMSCSVLWMNKAYQDLESEEESVVMKLYKFKNINASSIRTIMVADCVQDTTSNVTSDMDCSSSLNDVPSTSACSNAAMPGCSKPSAADCCNVTRKKPKLKRSRNDTIEYSEDYHKVQSTSQSNVLLSDSSDDGLDEEEDSEPSALQCACAAPCSSCMKAEAMEYSSAAEAAGGEPSASGVRSKSKMKVVSCVEDQEEWQDCLDVSFSSDDYEDFQVAQKTPLHGGPCYVRGVTSTIEPQNKTMDKYLVFTMGTKTYTPHQVGIKRIKWEEAREKLHEKTPNPLLRTNEDVPPMLDQPDADVADGKFDEVDTLIEMNGHIIGMALSPDQRYLYVNSRPWPKDYKIENPLYPPPIASEIDIHVIDIVTMKQVGLMHRSHKAYTSDDECFFIFLDVCDEYVASGAEDRHGYLWDRHYGVNLGKFGHTDVVNAVAFNPKDNETLVTVSDDQTFKVWRSRNRQKQWRQENPRYDPTRSTSC